MRSFYITGLVTLMALITVSCQVHRNISNSIPAEVGEAALQQVNRMSDNEAFWTGSAVPISHMDSPEFAARCEQGALSYCATSGHVPSGGWIVKSEIDLVGDAQKEVVWQIIPPVTGTINYLNNALVYNQSGEFLFHAPPHIIFSAKKGNDSHGSLAKTTPTRYEFVIIGADEWQATPAGVTMVSYDVRDYIDAETGEFSKPGVLQVTKRSFTSQGVQTSEQSYAPTSPEYNALRTTLRSICERASAAKSNGVNHVSALVNVAMEDEPAWLSGVAPIDALMKQWAIRYLVLLQKTRSITPAQAKKSLKK